MAKSSKTKESLPTRHSSHLKEDESLLLFKQMISPWLVYDIKGNSDYGIDASVEITKDKLQSQDQLVTGKRFNVQLKSTTVKVGTDFSVQVKRTTFNYWYQCTTPVFVFLIDLTSKEVFYKQIDDKLLTDLSKKNPNWHSQETISIKFSSQNKADRRTLLNIEDFVYKWTYKPTKILTPGEYYNNINEAIDFVKTFKKTVENYNFLDFNSQIDDNLKEISNSIFNLCIIGPSRVGKSTLINALTYREASPVDVLPTTGVPIVMLPGYPEEVNIHFEDKPKITGPVSLDFISEYADQKKNKHNNKNVTLVDIRIVSEFLEKGFSITDVPGIDDINPKIKSIAKSTIYSANAILYVISVGPHKQGEFKLTDQHLADLKEVKENLNRIFLVFNKVDLLSKSELETLKVYIDETLSDYGITDLLAHEPIYISSKKSFEVRVFGKKGKDSVRNLEDSIVKYLINGNLNGVNNLLANFANSLDLIGQVSNICHARLSDTKLSVSLAGKINTVRTELKELQGFIRKQRNTAYKEIHEYISMNFEEIISYLEQDMKNTPVGGKLPSRLQVTLYFQSQTDASVSRVYEYAQQITYELQSKVNLWVSDKLKQVQINLDEINADSTFSLNETQKFRSKVQNIYSIKENLSSNVLVTAYNLVEKAVIGFVDLVASIFKTHEEIKKERIAELIKPARENFKKLETEFLNSSSNYLNNVCRSIENKTIERSTIYLNTLHAELNTTGVALSQTQKQNIEALKAELTELETKGARKMLSIKNYANGIL